MARKTRRVGCCGQTRIGRSIVRNASKTMEKQMIAQADLLYKDPFIVLPECKDTISEKRFKKERKLIEKVVQIKDDTAKLEKLSNKKLLAGAIAGTLLIHHAQKASFLAAAPMPTGTVLFAQRGNASREHLIAVQHTDDPYLRMFAIRDIAFKFDLHIYSWDNGFISTGEKPNPPAEFVDYIFKMSHLSLKNNIATCGHIPHEHVKDKKVHNKPYIHIYWNSADVTIGICKECAQTKSNFIFDATKYMIEPDISEDFHVNVVGKVIKDDTSTQEVETRFVDDYFIGKLSDRLMIEKNMRNRLDDLKGSSEVKYVLDGKSFDQDAEGFIDALHPNDYEKKALLYLLEKHDQSIVVDDVTPNGVIELLWEEHGQFFLENIVDNKEKAKDLFSLSEVPSQIIKTAFEVKKLKEVLKDLPSYTNLPPIASFADHIARVFRTDGREKMISEAKKHPDNTKGKSLCYAFLLVVGKASDMRWKFKKDEVESGEFLEPYAEKLLHCSPEEYHAALQDLLTYSGTSIDLEKAKA